MSGIFGGGSASSMQNKQIKQMNKLTQQGLGQIDPNGVSNALTSYADTLNQNGVKPVSFTTPGYGITVNNSGVGVQRTPETQGIMDALLTGAGADNSGYNSLLSQIAPGFGALTQNALTDINNQANAALGNLKSQLARRRVLGASFANSQLTGLNAQYDQMRQKAIADSWQQEMTMTLDTLKQRTDARNSTLSQAMSQIQFEGNMGTQLTQQLMSNMNNLASLQADLVKTAATLKLQGQESRAGVVNQLGSTVLGSYPQFAQLKDQESSALPNLLASIAGTVLTPALAGGGSALGNALFGSGAMNTAASFAPKAAPATAAA